MVLQEKALRQKNLIAVGGLTPGSDGSTWLKRTDTTLEPVCFHNMPDAIYDEYIHSFYLKGCVDLSPLDGKFAFQMLISRGAYIGITFNDDHTRLLDERLVYLVKNAMITSGHSLFNASFAKALQVGGGEPQTQVGAKKKKAAATGKKKAVEGVEDETKKTNAAVKKKAAATKKKAKDVAVESVDEESPVFSDGDDDDDVEDGVWDPFKEDVE